VASEHAWSAFSFFTITQSNSFQSSTTTSHQYQPFFPTTNSSHQSTWVAAVSALTPTVLAQPATATARVSLAFSPWDTTCIWSLDGSWPPEVSSMTATTAWSSPANIRFDTGMDKWTFAGKTTMEWQTENWEWLKLGLLVSCERAQSWNEIWGFSRSYMCLFVPVLLGPAIKVLVVIKVFVESSAVDNTTSLSFAIKNIVTSLGSLLLHRSYM
jgi:hypothetical protein